MKNSYKIKPLSECKKMSYKKLQKYFEKYTDNSSRYSYELSILLDQKEEEYYFMKEGYY